MSDSPANAGFIAPDPTDLATHFPGYVIESLIATGGMGAVYRATQISLDRTVALKILPTELSKDAAFCAGFEAEAKAMARLNHPNLIGVYDFGEVNGMLYIIMEYVPGKSIYHSAYGRAIDAAETIRLVTGVCNGLAHAHENGILHRDIKPSNILLDHNTQPKIGDFGLARPIDWKIEEGDEIFGTPHYTAPEVVSPPHNVDYRADIFSVGVMLHELLTGKLPADDPRPASAIIRCDPRFDAIIKKATQTLPAARYSSASDMAKDLQAISTSLAQKVNRAPAGINRGANQSRPHVYAKRKKSSGPPIVMVVVLLVIAAVAAYHFLSSKPPLPKPVDDPEIVVPAMPDYPSKNTPKISSDPVPKVKPKPKVTDTPKVDTPKDRPKQTKPEIVKEPVKNDPPIPDFDVPGFYDRARKIMQEKAKPLLSAHAESLADNLASFEKEIRRLARRMKIEDDRVERNLAPVVEECKNNGNRVPAAFPAASKFFKNPELMAIHANHLQQQTGFDDTLHQGLSQLSSTYVLGIEKQIERLQAVNDVASIKLLQGEIGKTKDSPDYFSGLMTKPSGNE